MPQAGLEAEGCRPKFSVFKTLALLALIPALAFNISGAEVPISLSRLTGLLWQAMVPVMLIALGGANGRNRKNKY